MILACGGSTGSKGSQGDAGPPGEAGVPGEAGAPGEAGVVPPLVNNIWGTVTSDGTKPIAGVTVSLSPGTTASTTTDANGQFTFTGVAIGSYQLTFTDAGFTTQTAIAPCQSRGRHDYYRGDDRDDRW